MSYARPLDAHADAQNVVLYARLYYQDQAPSGSIAYDLYLPIWWSLQRNPGKLARLVPYQTSIGDLEVRISEVASDPPKTGGVTGYEVFDDQIASEGGKSLLLEIIGQHLLPFAKAVLEAAANTYNPFFGPILIAITNAIFRRAGSTDGDKKTLKSLRLRSLPWWGLKVWNDSPGVLPLRLKVGYVMDPGYLPAGPFRAAGKVGYELDIAAETGGLLGGGFQKTGVVQLPRITLTVKWS